MDEGGLGLEGWRGLPEDVVGSWAPEEGDVRHWERAWMGKRMVVDC